MSCNYKTNIKDIQSKYTFKIFCAGDTSQIEQEIGNLSDLTTTAKNNLVSAINEVHSDTETNATAISGLQNSKEDKSNKVTSISSASTDTQYPSAKAVYDSQITQDETISTLETNLEETKEELDYYKTIYNVLPKVSGNGESITLNNTGESILKLDLSGQCKQDSTTGINLFDKLTSGTYSGITLTQNDDGSFILNGTSDASNFKQFAFENDIVIPSGSYSLYVEANKGISTNSLNISLYDTSNNQVCNKDYNDVSNLKDVINFSVNAETTIRGFRSWIGNTYTANNIKIKCMLVSGTYTTSTIPSYEEYTGGIPSPNPSYPQPINVVSGDNEVVVCGKNIFDKDSGTLVSKLIGSNTRYGYKLPKATQNFYISRTTDNNSFAVYEDINGTLTLVKSVTTTIKDITNSSNDFYLICTSTTNQSTAQTSFSGDEFMVSYDNISYEPYNGDTYEVNLGVENILQTDTIDFGASTYNLTLGHSINAGDYTISGINITATSGQFVLYGIDENSTQDTLLANKNWASLKDGYSFTTTKKYVSMKIYTNTAVKGNLQLEEGTKVSSFSPYGQKPIKMRGIGTYEDYFVRNSGKNLLNKELIVSGNTSNYEVTQLPTGVRLLHKNSYSTGVPILTLTLKPNTTYVYSQKAKATSGDPGSGIKTTNGSYSYVTTGSQTITTESDGVIIILVGSSLGSGVICDYTEMQLEEGSQATTYEPYGTGQWCKYNAIGNVVLDGSENYGETYGNIRISVSDILSGGTDNLITCISDYFMGIKYADRLSYTNPNVTQENLSTYVQFRNTGQTIEQFKTWLGTHNTQVDYILASPYLSLIENETLISQLDKVEKALAKQGQTNISQVNNDAPFKIYASALMKISGE